MKNEAIHQLFDNYLKGKLSRSEKNNFEENLEKDEQLRKEFKEYEYVVQGINEYNRENFKKYLNEIDKSAENYQLKKIRRYRILKYAASVIIILSIGLYLLYFPLEREKLFKEYFTPYPNDLIEHSRGASLAGEWSNLSNEQYDAIVMAMNHYDNEEYQEAANIFNEMQLKGDYPTIIFFHALSEITLGNTKKAIEMLEPLTKSYNNNYFIASQWYLALLYLKTNQLEASKELLKKIAITPSEFSTKAESLLKEINS